MSPVGVFSFPAVILGVMMMCMAVTAESMGKVKLFHLTKFFLCSSSD